MSSCCVRVAVTLTHAFSEIVAEAEKKRRMKHAWLYEKVDEQLEVSVVVWGHSRLLKTASFVEIV